MSIAWNQDGRCLASSGGGELMVWDARNGERVRTWTAHQGVVTALTWSPCGEMIMSGGSDGTLRWWQVSNGECVRVHATHQGAIRSLRCSPDGRLLASCGDDGAIWLWSCESGEPLQMLRRDRPYERLNITGIRGLSEARKASMCFLGAFE